MKRRIVVFGVLALFLAVGGAYAYRYWYDNEHYVQTDNAYVSGSLVQVNSPHPGKLVSLDVEIGQKIREGEVLARVAAPVVTTMPGSPATGVTYYQSSNLGSGVAASISGLVVAKPASVGDNLSAGQPIVTLVDGSRLWIVANVDETRVSRVRPGQKADVYVDMLGRSLQGTVEAITPAAASMFSLMPAQNTNGNFTKVSQVIPVKIAVDYRGLALYPGASASVRIRVKGEE